MVLIIDGCDAVGKTAVVRCLAKKVPLTHVVKLSGPPEHAGGDDGYMRRVYEGIYCFLRASNLNGVIFDRFTTSERVYSSLFHGRDTAWIDDYEERIVGLGDVRQYILMASPSEMAKRLEAKVLDHPHETQPDLNTLLEIQNAYIKTVATKQTKYPTVIMVTDRVTPDEIANRLVELAKWKER